MSDETDKLIDQEIRKLIDNAENHARKVLKKNMKHFHSLAKALLEFEPKLKEASDKEAFHRSLFSYVDANFLLKNTQGKKMQLLSVKEVDHQGHAHQSNFEFYFKGSEFVELQNELFFNISKNHKNHHFVSIRDRIYQLTTSVVAPSFLIN